MTGVDQLQNDDAVRAILSRQDRLEGERSRLERVWRDVDERVDPDTEGGFYTGTKAEATSNFDATAAEGLERYTAAIAGLTIPRNQRWHGLTVADKDLARSAAVQRWCEHATDQLFAHRYAAHAGFEMQATADIRRGGKYGYCGLWADEWLGRGLFYRSINNAEVYCDEDFRGRVDTTHRKFELTVRQAVQQFGEENLTDRMRECWTSDKASRRDEKFEFLHVLCPRGDYQSGAPGVLGKPIASETIAIEEKAFIRRGGYRKPPLMVSRTSLGSKYGRSPAMRVLGTVKTLEEIAKTMLRTAHKACDPALMFYDDGDISKLVTKPGGLNPGLVDEFGRPLVQPMPGGGNIAFGMELQEAERKVVRDAFLEQLFQILTNPADRMTATQVLEMVQKQGVLVGPFAGQHETEKLGPLIERELDILMHAGWIEAMPPEMVEAGARAVPIYQNPLARMSRAEEAAGFTRWVEVAVQLAAFDPGVLDMINTDRAMSGLAEVLSVRPSWQNSPEEVAAKREARQEREAAAQMAQLAPSAASAALDLAKANEMARAA